MEIKLFDGMCYWFMWNMGGDELLLYVLCMWVGVGLIDLLKLCGFCMLDCIFVVGKVGVVLMMLFLLLLLLDF